MSDSEFIELLNLYLDHEIGAGDLARLEAEVTQNQERRRTYRQYCQMHKACSLLANQAPEAAPAWGRAKPALAAPRRRGWSSGVFAGGLLAAACAAVLVAVRLHPTPLAPALAPKLSPPVAVAAVQSPAPSRGQLQPAFTLRAMPSLVDDSGSAMPSAPDLNAQFAWMNRVQLAPISGLSVEPTAFDPVPVFIGVDNRALSSVPNQDPSIERASFQIGK